MIVDNYRSAITTPDGGASAKAKGGYSYIMIGKDEENGAKNIYLIKREGQRSWGGYALTDVADELCHIKGNSSTILNEVFGMCRYYTEVFEIPNSDKTLLRKAIMEAMCYGTVAETVFEIKKEV